VLHRENYHTQYVQFEVVEFQTTYNGFLRRPALTRLMMIPHCAYLVLKMSDPNGVISIKESQESYGRVPSEPRNAKSEDIQPIHLAEGRAE
jgi:hypothetical protein